MPTKRFELDGEPEAIARAIALEGKARRSRRWRRRAAPNRKMFRTGPLTCSGSGRSLQTPTVANWTQAKGALHAYVGCQPDCPCLVSKGLVFASPSLASPINHIKDLRFDLRFDAAWRA
jgi:hypothetical protein